MAKELFKELFDEGAESLLGAFFSSFEEPLMGR